MSVMHSTTGVNGVMKAFIPWTDSPSRESARYLTGLEGLARARNIVDSLKKEDLRRYGLGEFKAGKLRENRPLICDFDDRLGIVKFGPYDREDVNVAALFRRFDDYFPNQRLPEDLTAYAFICSPSAGLHPRAIINVFAALKMSGAEIASDEFADPLHLEQVGEWAARPSVEFNAIFRKRDVELTCIMGASYWRERYILDGQLLHGPGKLKMESCVIRMNVTLLEHHDSIEGREILNSGLREILDPLVTGGAPVFIRSLGDGVGPVQLAIGNREMISRKIQKEMSKELGIHEIGTIRGYEDPTR